MAAFTTAQKLSQLFKDILIEEGDIEYTKEDLISDTNKVQKKPKKVEKSHQSPRKRVSFTPRVFEPTPPLFWQQNPINDHETKKNSNGRFWNQSYQPNITFERNTNKDAVASGNHQQNYFYPEKPITINKTKKKRTGNNPHIPQITMESMAVRAEVFEEFRRREQRSNPKYFEDYSNTLLKECPYCARNTIESNNSS